MTCTDQIGCVQKRLSITYLQTFSYISYALHYCQDHFEQTKDQQTFVDIIMPKY